jgi:hypothetical protein
MHAEKTSRDKTGAGVAGSASAAAVTTGVANVALPEPGERENGESCESGTGKDFG